METILCNLRAKVLSCQMFSRAVILKRNDNYNRFANYYAIRTIFISSR